MGIGDPQETGANGTGIMKDRYSFRVPWDKLGPWAGANAARRLYTIEFELTARCNNECRHCYINLPAADKKAKAKELSLEEIKDVADQALTLGAVWCLLTGGEPLLREDFADVYLHLKKSGLLVSVFTNAVLISDEHVRLFKRYPPKNMEVSVYGVTRETYEKVTRKPGSFEAFSRGLGLLLENGIPVRLKAMALRSNVHELEAISDFCRARTKDYFRFDPFLHMRYDRDRKRNAEIAAERLSPDEIIALERSDPERFQALKEHGCDLILPEEHEPGCDHLIKCGAGRDSFVIGRRRRRPPLLFPLPPGLRLRPARREPERRLLQFRSEDQGHPVEPEGIPNKMQRLCADEPVPVVPRSRPSGNRRAGQARGLFLQGRPRQGKDDHRGRVPVSTPEIPPPPLYKGGKFSSPRLFPRRFPGRLPLTTGGNPL